MKCVKVCIKGLVQGVGYRRFAEKRAQELGLTGWVRNMDQGHVEGCAEGNQEQIEKWIEQLKRGPMFSRVSNVEIHWEEYSGQYSSFKITY